MAEGRSVQSECLDRIDHSPSDHGTHETRSGENRLIWEKPLGTKRGYLDEPGPRFVDVEGEADKEATRWERGITTE